MKVNELQYSITLNDDEVRSAVKALHEFYIQHKWDEDDDERAHAKWCQELRNSLGAVINVTYSGNDL